MPFTNPVPVFNFMVTMWDCQGPGFFGIDGAGAGGWGIASRIASGFVNMASQLLLGAFSEVGGLNAELELESYSAGGANSAVKKFVKSGKHQLLTLKRGLTFNTDIWDWHQQVLHGEDPMIRKSGIVLLLERAPLANAGKAGKGDFGDDLGAQLTRPPVAAWYFENGLPERLVGPALEGKTNAVAIEQLDIAHEGLTRVSLAMIPGVADAAAGVGGLVSAAAAGATAAATVASLDATRGDNNSLLHADPHYDPRASLPGDDGP
jgi:phage tail-like protein